MNQRLEQRRLPRLVVVMAGPQRHLCVAHPVQLLGN